MRLPSLRASFQNKLLVSFLAVGILPLLLCTTLILGMFQVTLARGARENAQEELGTATADFTRVVEACGGVLERLRGESLVAEALTEGGSAQAVYNTLYDAAAPLIREADFAIYDAEGRLRYATDNTMVRTLPTNWGVLFTARSEGLACRGVDGFGADSEDCMRLARTVPGREGPAGYVVARLTWAHFLDLLEGSDVVVLDRFWDQVYVSPTLQDQDLAARLRACLLAGRSLDEAGEDCTYHVLQDPASGFSVVLRQPKPLADWILRLFYLVTGLSILLCAAVCVQVARSFSRQLFEPIRTLNSAMAAVEEGDLDARVEVTGTDEINQLSGRFNRMTQRLRTNLAQSIHQQQELGDAQIRMMQAQLNPHFLYNTLDTLKWLGKINRVEEVSTISADLADILRQSISADEFVALRDELKLLERYVEIQKIRFPGKFSYSAQVEDEVLDALVPKLMLQPLVENAIIHGFEDGSSGRITVTAGELGGRLVITVQDDGCGLSQESRERFERREKPASGHLGLYNVDAILRLHYGPESGLQFMSPSGGRGTCIRITLPIREGGGETP